MKVVKVAIYARVSTAGQELESQIDSCKKLCELKDLEVADIYQDIGSGKDFTRPNFHIMLRRLRAGEYGGLVAFRLDRLGRKARDLSLLIEELTNRGIKIFTVYDNYDTTTAIGRAMQEIVLIMAQLERDQISEATKQRLETLRASGKKLGRKPLSKSKIKRIQELGALGYSYREIKAKTGVSIGKISDVLGVAK